MMRCKYHHDRRCTLGKFGAAPSLGVCSVCPDYAGPARGLGDVVHTLARPVARVLRLEGCAGCQKRREKLNQIAPLGGHNGH